MDFDDLPPVNCLETVTSVKDTHYDVKPSSNQSKSSAKKITYQTVTDDAELFSWDPETSEECCVCLHNGEGPCRFLGIWCQRTQEGFRAKVLGVHTETVSNIQPYDEITRINGRLVSSVSSTKELKELFTAYMETGNFDGNILTMSIRRRMTDQERNSFFRDMDVHILVLLHGRRTSSMMTRSSSRYSQTSSAFSSVVRRILWVSHEVKEKRDVVIKTRTRMHPQEFLTVENEKLTTKPLSKQTTKTDYVFTIHHLKACYRGSHPGLMAKVVSCCAIQWKAFYLQGFVDSFDNAGVELVQCGEGPEMWTKDDPRIFKHRAVSGGQAFECLLYKNFFLSYRPCLDDVTLRHFRGRPSKFSRVEVLKNSAYLATFDIAPSKIIFLTAFGEDEPTKSKKSSQNATPRKDDAFAEPHQSIRSVSNFFTLCCCCGGSKTRQKSDDHRNGLTPVISLQPNGTALSPRDNAKQTNGSVHWKRNDR